MTLPPLPDPILLPIVQLALAEDLGRAGDVTTQATIDPTTQARWVMRARKPGVLTAERTMLNFVGQLSGVASLTRAFVEAVAGTGVKIADTRKTHPGMRALQKRAVRLGGGSSHRFALDDAILIKDNHVAAAGGVGAALARAKSFAGHLLPIEVEVDGLAQLAEALPFEPTCVMLDNFSLEDLRTAVALAKGRTTLEASGNVTLSTVRAIAETGVDVISSGALTHSAPCLDIGLDAG
ncbi:MAG: carboxylating nicotinate-nucleotide diphosphorylase [Hyphomonadaceae bacterium]|nr:carboxylating nicotinate-nucleotide diphosphorylase [Hyphomonadaceae bacterium]